MVSCTLLETSVRTQCLPRVFLPLQAGLAGCGGLNNLPPAAPFVGRAFVIGARSNSRRLLWRILNVFTRDRIAYTGSQGGKYEYTKGRMSIPDFLLPRSVPAKYSSGRVHPLVCMYTGAGCTTNLYKL